MNNITAIILTRNEEQNIAGCFDSVTFCDETLVIDDNSTDSTVEKAKQKNARVISRAMNGDFAAQRNYGMEQAKNDWILFVDADERVSPELRKEIESLSDQNSTLAYFIPRRDFFWGTELKHGEVSKVRNRGLIRLVKKGSGSWSGSVHEEFKTDKPSGKLNSFIDHYPHQTIKEFLHEINMYSTLRAKELQSQGKKSSILSILSYPFFKFLLVYFVYLGFLDGPAGFAYAFVMSFHSFLVRAKLYQYTKLA
jgi:glycosyltransferase involved in cell wall biosynthesis